MLWPGKFGGRVVNINQQDFNPEIHQIPGTEPVTAKGLESKTKPEMVKPAKAKSVETKDAPGR